MKLKNIIYWGVLLLLSGSLQAGIRKSNLKILYVGGSPDMYTQMKQVDSVLLAESVASRMVSFEKMLKHYFNEVTVVNAKDYQAALSGKYDVTVMDGVPNPILPEVRETDASGRVTKYHRPGYLPDDFDRPVVFIGEMSNLLGERIGLKLDWYCLCLDADAYHFRSEHPIFHGPFPVTMTIEQKPTPEAGKAAAIMAGKTVPDSIPMWRVQKEGYQSKPGMRVGMVSRPGGFEDSPEAEFISGGVSAKTLDAVAIGRHGNFLHWGFAASPLDLTEEAQQVLANAIVYIAGFAGQTPIARKYNERISTRDEVVSRAAMATKKSYEDYLTMLRSNDSMMLARQKQAREKQQKGEVLDEMDGYVLQYKTKELPTYEGYLQSMFPDLFARFGVNAQAYADYYKTNEGYFVAQEDEYGLVVDEEVKSLGIPNNDIRLLDKAIRMWEQGENIDKARSILWRYTLCRFETPKEWRRWFNENKKKLFFTEPGGWLFLVNTRDKSIPGNDYRIREVKTESAEVTTSGTDERNPVAITASLENMSDGNRQIVVKIKIHPGYHIYARVGDTDPFVPTSIRFDLPKEMTKIGEMKTPSGRAYNQAGTVVFEKEAIFRQEIKGNSPGKIVCTVGYQCCDESICMPPTEKKIECWGL